MLKNAWHKAKRRWLPYLIAYSAKAGMWLLMRTCRIEISGLDSFMATARQSPCILMLWHNRMVLIPEVLSKHAPQFTYTAFISKSRDGDPLALIAQSYHIGRALRVPHNARHKALEKMITQLKYAKEIMLVTPDGPRGPRYVVKPGIVMAARHAQAQIVPFSWEADRMWQLKTWDGMMVPKPFAKIRVTFGAAISVPKNEEKEDQKTEELLKNALMEICN